MGKFWLLILSGGYLLVAVDVASSIYVNQLNATKLKSSKTQFQFKFELSLAQLSHSLFLFYLGGFPDRTRELPAATVTMGEFYKFRQLVRLPFPLWALNIELVNKTTG